MKKPVRCVENGTKFGSLREAGTWIGQDYQRKGNEGGSFAGSNISHVVNLPSRTAGGYHWEFIHTNGEVSSILPQEKEEDSLPRIYKAIGRKPPKQPKIEYPPEDTSIYSGIDRKSVV